MAHRFAAGLLSSDGRLQAKNARCPVFALRCDVSCETSANPLSGPLPQGDRQEEGAIRRTPGAEKPAPSPFHNTATGIHPAHPSQDWPIDRKSVV